MFGFLKKYYYRAKYLTITYSYQIDTLPDNNTELLFDYLDDEVLVIDKTFKGILKIMALIILLPLTILLTYIVLDIFGDSFFDREIWLSEFTIFYVIFLLLYLFIIYLTAFVLIAPGNYKQKFYRRTGMVEMPKRWLRGWIKGETITFPFCDEAITQSGGMGAASLHLNAPNGRSMLLMRADMSKEFSFLLWYMDRNRPLPPGKRLDPYRAGDYLRRKAAGFPAPLRAAKIKIPPEVIPEQTKE